MKRMIPTGNEDGEAQDAWVFHSTPSHPSIAPGINVNCSDFASCTSSLSPFEERTRTRHSSNSSHYIPGYSPHLFYSPGMAGSPRALPLAKMTSTEKRSQLLKRMREPEDETGLGRIDMNTAHFQLSADFKKKAEKKVAENPNSGKDPGESGASEKKKVDLISVQVVTDCKIIKDKRDCALKPIRRTAKKKLVMEEPPDVIHKDSKVSHGQAGKEVEDTGGELPELLTQITDNLQISNMKDVKANLPKKVRARKSFGISQTVTTSNQVEDAEPRGVSNGRKEEEKKNEENMTRKKKGAKKSFGKSETMVTECQGSREIIPTGKKDPTQNSGKQRRFCWSKIVLAGFKNTSDAISPGTEDCAKIKEKTGAGGNRVGSYNEENPINLVENSFETQEDKKPPEGKERKDPQLEVVESQKLSPMMAPKKRWQSKALGEDVEEKRKGEGGKAEESSEAVKKGWKEKAKDGECYVPPSA